MSIFRRNTQIEKIRSDVGALEARRGALQKQHTTAEAKLAVARAAARDRIIAGDDNVDDAAVVEAERRLAALDDALAEIDVRLENESAALAKAEDAKAREHEAKAREAAAVKIEALAVRLERGLAEVVSIASEIRDSVPGCLEVHLYEDGFGRLGRLNPQKIINACISEGLFAIAPDLFALKGKDGIGSYWMASLDFAPLRPDGNISAFIPKRVDVSFRHVSGSIEASIVEPLRRSASLIRNGELPADAPATPGPQRARIHDERAE
jgi:hypothetical protein